MNLPKKFTVRFDNKKQCKEIVQFCKNQGLVDFDTSCDSSEYTSLTYGKYSNRMLVYRPESDDPKPIFTYEEFKEKFIEQTIEQTENKFPHKVFVKTPERWMVASIIASLAKEGHPSTDLISTFESNWDSGCHLLLILSESIWSYPEDYEVDESKAPVYSYYSFMEKYSPGFEAPPRINSAKLISGHHFNITPNDLIGSPCRIKLGDSPLDTISNTFTFLTPKVMSMYENAADCGRKIVEYAKSRTLSKNERLLRKLGLKDEHGS